MLLEFTINQFQKVFRISTIQMALRRLSDGHDIDINLLLVLVKKADTEW